MSLIFGGGQKSKPQYSSLQVQTSASNMPVTVAGGLCRLAPNLMWFDDFESHKQKPQGGKGGGGKGGSQYTYSTAVMMGLCQGPSTGIQRVFVDNEKNSNLTKLNLTFFDGSDPQTPWSYLTTNHPDAALSYPGTVYVASPKYDLGQSAALPQHSFEIEALLFDTAPGGTGDADVALFTQLFLTADVWGCGFPADEIGLESLLSGPDAGTTGDAAWQTYCTAMSLGMSPALSSQEDGATILDRWAKIFNAAIVWNGEVLKFVPYSLETVTGNGVTYLPVSESAYVLTDDDYMSGGGTEGEAQDPVIVRRRDPSQVKNRLQMEILSRTKEYNAVPIEWIDQGLIDQHGNLPDGVMQAHEVCEPSMATILVSLVGQRNAFRGANQYSFKLPPSYCLLEGMDLLTVEDPVLGTVQVQVDRMEEDDDFNLEFTCSMIMGGSTSSNGFTEPDQTPGGNDTGVSPGPVNPPIFMEPPSSLAGGSPQVWAAVSGGDGTNAGQYWGGAFVWVSGDGGASYAEIGEVTEPARMGKTTSALASYGGSNPDTAHTVGVNLAMSAGSLIGVSTADAASAATLCYLGGELLSYKDALLTSTSNYTLQTELYRGLYGSTPGAHLTNVAFARMDDSVFKYTLPSQYIGQALYFKFQSYNIYGGGVEDLSSVTAYPYTPTGAGYGTGSGGAPATPTGLSGSAGSGFSKLVWNANSVNDNVTQYGIWRVVGPAGSFGSATKIGTAPGTTYTDTSGTYGQVYTYFVVAENAIGTSGASSGVDLTATAAAGIVRFYGSIDGRPDANEELFDIEMAGDESFSSGFPSNLGSCDVAPTGSVTFPILKNGVSVGTMNIAAAATTATWTLASGLTFVAGDRFSMRAPLVQDATLSGPRYTFIGRRG